MKKKLVIDGNAVYEVDEDCMLRKRLNEEEPVNWEKRFQNREEETQGRRHYNKP